MKLQRTPLLFAVVTLFRCTPVSALKTFNTTCTLPPDNAMDHFYYVSSPDVRGSANIVWTCLATLTVCVWNVLHLSIPEQRNGRHPGFWGDFKWLGIWRDLPWALVIAFAPEIELACSVCELILVRKHLRRLQEIPSAKSTWTLTHAFYLNMGGLVTIADGKRYRWNAERIQKAIESGALAPTAPITAEEIMDKSKSDFFAKSLSVGQILYFYINFFARIAKQLPISQLELGVATVALFSLIAYACLLHKPRAVRTPSRITVEDFHRPPRFEELFGPAYDGRYDVRYDSFHDADGSLRDCFLLVLLYSMGGAALGALHLAAWNSEFPSAADAWIWRVAGILVIASGVLTPGTVCFALLLKAREDLRFVFDEPDPSHIRLVFDAVGLYACPILYVIARLALFVEMIRCLFYLPADSFRTTSWAMSIPHVG